MHVCVLCQPWSVRGFVSGSPFPSFLLLSFVSLSKSSCTWQNQMSSGLKLKAKQRCEELWQCEEGLLALAGCSPNHLCACSRAEAPQQLFTLLRLPLVFPGFPWGHLVRCWGSLRAPAGAMRCGKEGRGWLESQGLPASLPTVLLMRVRDVTGIPREPTPPSSTSSNHLKPAQCCQPERFSLLAMNGC